MLEAVDEDMAEVTAKTILETLRRMRTKNPRINVKLLAKIVKAQGTLQMSAESPRKKDRKRALKRKLT